LFEKLTQTILNTFFSNMKIFYTKQAILKIETIMSKSGLYEREVYYEFNFIPNEILIDNELTSYEITLFI